MINKIDNSNNTAFKATLNFSHKVHFSPKDMAQLEQKFAERTKSMPNYALKVYEDGLDCFTKGWERSFSLDDEGVVMLRKMSPKQFLSKAVKLVRAFDKEQKMMSAGDKFLQRIKNISKQFPSVADDFEANLGDIENSLHNNLYNEIFANDAFLKHIVE